MAPKPPTRARGKPARSAKRVSPAPRDKGGRPKADIPKKELAVLASLQCTYAEAAAVLGVTEKTIKNRLSPTKGDPELREAWLQGQKSGLVSLRRAMFRLANKSARMAIFLAAHYLNMKDVTRFEHSGPDGGPIEHDVPARELIASRIAGIAARTREGGDPREPDR